ncbi:hypothetical protein [Stenotrophomonas sp.]|uniref:hypothetical protein n=1 Tax=Stenotrophomonas sp. TaxID=69392 RepID=UPI0028ADD0FE|nr:hypothetical protein [Stenotrophomonas sp.]
MMFTLADYDAAKAAVVRLEKSWENYMGGNTKKFETQLREARDRLSTIELSLLESGELEPTELQAANLELDRLYPYAKAKTRQEFGGNIYEIHYWRESISLSGKTTRLRHEWRRIESTPPL